MTNKELKGIIEIFEKSSLSKLKLSRDDMKIELEKPMQQAVPVVRTAPATPPEVTEQKNEPVPSNLIAVKAPLVGTYYESPAPDQPAFVREGQTVMKGDTLFIIEAMKVMNEITAPASGTIKKIHLSNGDMVMFDQSVMEIE